jgi:hypothetical protein
LLFVILANQVRVNRDSSGIVTLLRLLCQSSNDYDWDVHEDQENLKLFLLNLGASHKP